MSQVYLGLHRPLSPGQRKKSRRRWFDAPSPEIAESDKLTLSCSKRACSFGFAPTENADSGMHLINTRTREVVRVLWRSRCFDHKGYSDVQLVVKVDRAVQDGIKPAGEEVRAGDQWLILGHEENLFPVLPMMIDTKIGILREPYSIHDRLKEKE